MYLRHHGKRSHVGPRRVDDDAEGILTERRLHRRRAGAWTAMLETMRGDRIGCVVLDLSPGGAKLLLEKTLPVGELVTFITERFGTHRGRIAWSSGARAGLAFADFGAARGSAQALVDKPEFLRGRAEVLRRLAQNARNGETVSGLLWAAKGFDEAAERIEAQQRWPSEAPSIRREDILFGRQQLLPPPRQEEQPK
jgi:PilZ domain